MRGWRAVVVGVLLLTACTDDAPDAASAPTAELTVTVAPGEVLADQPVELAIDGAEPGQQVEVEVSATDDDGVAWSGSARALADDDGRVALDDPMEPYTVMAPDDGDPAAAFAWGDGPVTFTVTATTEGSTATAEVRRRLAAEGVTGTPTDPDADGIVGTLWTPAAGTATGSALLLVGGSEGGVASPALASVLASHGVTTLAIAVFGAPGVPDELVEIPLETFTTGLAWLGARPAVDPERVWVLGASRGSEPAVLVAARHPELVAGVVLTSPSSVVGAGITDPTRSGWTEDGQPLPFAPWGTVAPAPDPAADLPIEEVDGPVIATCGGDDRLWPACRHAEALLDRRGDRPDDHLVQDPGAGHLVSVVVPYLRFGTPLGRDGEVLDPGGDALADDRVRAEAWPLVLEALGAR